VRAGDVAKALRAYRGPLLPHSDAPGIVSARRRLHDQVRSAVLGSHDAALLLAWGDTSWGGDDSDVWTEAMRVLPHGSQQHTLARLRLAALDEEFGAPPRM